MEVNKKEALKAAFYADQAWKKQTVENKDTDTEVYLFPEDEVLWVCFRSTETELNMKDYFYNALCWKTKTGLLGKRCKIAKGA